MQNVVNINPSIIDGIIKHNVENVKEKQQNEGDMLKAILQYCSSVGTAAPSKEIMGLFKTLLTKEIRRNSCRHNHNHDHNHDHHDCDHGSHSAYNKSKNIYNSNATENTTNGYDPMYVKGNNSNNKNTNAMFDKNTWNNKTQPVRE